MPALTSHQVKDLILKQLPILIKRDENVRTFIVHLIENISAPKKQTEDRFEVLLNEIHKLRDEGNRKWEAWEKKWEAWEKKWDEEKAENQKKWDENQKKWEAWEKKWDEEKEENQKKWEQNIKELQLLHKKYNQDIGAIGERWGLHAEGTFRNALSGILGEISSYQVSHFEDQDDSGEVFGYPANIEIDLIISNGKTFVAEIKASLSVGDLWYFIKKVDWWKKQKKTKPDGLLVISPMIHSKARQLAGRLGIRCFSYADEVIL